MLASSGLITVQDANPGGGITSVTLSVTSLSLNGSLLTVPMSGTDSSGNPYSLAYSGGSKLMVQMPAGIIVGQADPLSKAWQVNSMNNGGYSLSTMTVLSSGTGAGGPDWFTGTSGNDTIDAASGNDFIQWSGGNDIVNAGNDYDMVQLPMNGVSSYSRVDALGVLHIVSSTNGLDIYRITKQPDTSLQIEKMNGDGTTVAATMLLSNAETLAIGNQSHQLQVNYGGGQYFSGTPWDDQISVNASNIANLVSVWGDTGQDRLVFDVGSGYSHLEVFKSGTTYVLKGTPIAGGNLVELGRGVTALNGNGATMTFGTGVNAKSFSIYDIEMVRFVSGAVILDFVPVNDAPTFQLILTLDLVSSCSLTAELLCQEPVYILSALTLLLPATMPMALSIPRLAVARANCSLISYTRTVV